MSDAAIAALAVQLGERLRARRALCATAESCTGGLVAGAITDIAGSSEWFERGFVTYSNEAKIDQLGVSPQILARHGAVSEATARAMAEGALAHSRADVAVAITGIAGPGGGTPGKPVGLVCFAWAARRAATTSVAHRFTGDRAAVREASVMVALEGLLARA
ncbi:MAG: CinA family protein [Burkholderiales bacterium]